MSESQESGRKVEGEKRQKELKEGEWENNKKKKGQRERGMKRGREGRVKGNRRQDIKKEKEREKQESMRRKWKGEKTHRRNITEKDNESLNLMCDLWKNLYLPLTLYRLQLCFKV